MKNLKSYHEGTPIEILGTLKSYHKGTPVEILDFKMNIIKELPKKCHLFWNNLYFLEKTKENLISYIIMIYFFRRGKWLLS